VASTLELLLLTQLANRPQLIASTVLASTISTVTLPATGTLPQNFTNLRLLISAKSDSTVSSSGYDNAYMQFSGNATNSYSWSTWYMPQGGSSVSVAGANSQPSMQCAAIWNNHFATPGRGIATIDIPNYADGNNYKSFVGQSSATDGGAAGVMQTYSGMLNGYGTAVTSITVTMGVGNFLADSTFTLYGM
jgi:hypothetical protein